MSGARAAGSFAARAAGSFAASALVLLPACINTDAAVFVEPNVSSAALTVVGSALVTGVEGSFTVSLHLGPRAADDAEVLAVGFSIVTADAAQTLVPSLGVTASPEFPVTVPIDSDVAVLVSVAVADNQLEANARDALCAGDVRVRAVLQDSLRGSIVSADSEPFAPGGCP